jgi:dihydropteroate synthase
LRRGGDNRCGRDVNSAIPTDRDLVDEEKRRLASAIKVVKESVKVPVSADTTRSIPAEAAIKAGAEIINDVTGLKGDPNMAKLVADYGVSLIMVAREVTPQGGQPLKRVISALKQSLQLAEAAGISFDKIVIDPGIGFFRQTEYPWHIWDRSVIANLKKLRTLKRPIHVGVSRKSFIGKILNQEDPGQRLFGSLSAAAIAVFNGAHLIRTHDVKATVEAVRLAEYVRKNPHPEA